MKKSFSTCLVPLLLFVIWLAAMFIFRQTTVSDELFYTTLACGCIGVIVCLVYLLSFNTASAKTNESAYTTSIYTNTYLVVCLVANYVLSHTSAKVDHTLFINLVILCIYIAVVYYAHRATARVEATVQTVEAAMNVSSLISKKMAALLAVAPNEQIKKELLAVKQLFDYSNALSNSTTLPYENDIYARLGELETLIRQQSDDATLSQHIAALESAVKMRNALK